MLKKKIEEITKELLFKLDDRLSNEGRSTDGLIYESMCKLAELVIVHPMEIEQIKDQWKKWCGEIPGMHVFEDRIFAFFGKHIKGEGKWISVNDRLPVMGFPVLVFCPQNEFRLQRFVAGWDGYAFREFDIYGTDEDYTDGEYTGITHWSALNSIPNN